MIQVLGNFRVKMEEMESKTNETMVGTLDVINRIVHNHEKLMNERTDSKGNKSVLVKEPKLPKLVKGKKYEEWLKEI